MALKKNILAVLFVALAGSLFAITVPQLTAPVMDTAGIVDDAKEAELNTYLMAVSEQTGVPIAVLTLSSLGDETLEDVSITARFLPSLWKNTRSALKQATDWKAYSPTPNAGLSFGTRLRRSSKTAITRRAL